MAWLTIGKDFLLESCIFNINFIIKIIKVIIYLANGQKINVVSKYLSLSLFSIFAINRICIAYFVNFIFYFKKINALAITINYLQCPKFFNVLK